MKAEEIIIARLEVLQAGQDAMNGALGLMIDTLRSQTSLLKKLSEYASEEPAASPVTKVLGELTSAIMDLDASVGAMGLKFDRMSEAMATATKDGTGILPHVNGSKR